MAVVSRAVGGRRFMEARLSGDFHFAHCTPLQPNLDSLHSLPRQTCLQPELSTEKQNELRQIERDLKQRQDFSSMRSRLIVEIAIGLPPQQIKAAIENLKSATMKRSGTNSAAWSDVAASYLLLAQQQNNPVLLFDALEAVDKAVEADERSPEALFNRALILEYLSLETAARTAWTAYLALESDPDWRQEAREHLSRISLHEQETTKWNLTTERLTQGALSGSTRSAILLTRWAPEQARQLAQRELLTQWADTAPSPGEPEKVNQTLAVAHAIAKELLLIGGDHLLTDSLAAIAEAAENPERLATLRRGYSAFSKGMALYEERKHLSRASQQLQRASMLLRAGNSPFADWPVLYLAICEYSRSLPGTASARLAALVSKPKLNLYPALAGRVQWQLGLGQFAQGEREAAIRRFENASLVFQQIGDRESLAATQDLLASAYASIGEQSLSLNYRYLALNNLRWVKGERRRWVILKTTAESFLDRDQPSLALPILDELLRISGTNPEERAQALIRRSVALLKLGRYQQANLDESDAKSTLDHIEDPSLRSRLKIDLLVEQVEAILAHKPAEALSLLEKPIQFYRETENELLLSRALLARARAALANGEEIRAEQSLTEALEHADRQWSALTDQHFKLAFQGELKTTFDELLWNQYYRDPAAAFATTERARSRILLERAGGRPLSAAEVQSALPPNTTIVEYAIDHNSLLVWTLSRDRLVLSVAKWDTTYWSELARNLNRAAQEGDEPAFRNTLSGLYKLLMRPICDRLPLGRTLVFVPDGEIASAPFSALYNSDTGHYLIENYTVVIAPSSSVFVAATRRVHHVDKTLPLSLLAVGAPAVDKGWHPDLSSLPAARDEASAISRIFQPYGSLLIGKQATPTAVLAALKQRNVIHFAAHALIDSANAERSILALAPTNAEPSSGDLPAWAIERLPLFNTRLVVLAACSGAVGPIVKGEGTLSIARSFLYAGTPTVVATIWPLSDESTHFFQFFYSKLREGHSPSESLQLAQLHFLMSGNPSWRAPWIWGGIRAYGAA
jgi:CHAT domain-containing protein